MPFIWDLYAAISGSTWHLYAVGSICPLHRGKCAAGRFAMPASTGHEPRGVLKLPSQEHSDA
jgi:hypothetical protein